MDYERIKNTEQSQFYEFALLCETYLRPFFSEALRSPTFKKNLSRLEEQGLLRLRNVGSSSTFL